MGGPIMTLIYFTLIVLGLAATVFWLMYSAGVHGTFRFRWDEWENWSLIAVMLFCFGLPVRNLVLINRNMHTRK
jgi:4-amino-4-deoxy-L-arabinose transferase-like glycosyltransferase